MRPCALAGAARRATRCRARSAGGVAPLGIGRRTVNAARRGQREPLDDVTLARKVESELDRRARVPKGHISFNAEDGVVFLRGVIERQEDIERIAAATRKITGVRAVENLIHLPGTPAPASRPKSERVRSRNAASPKRCTGARASHRCTAEGLRT